MTKSIERRLAELERIHPTTENMLRVFIERDGLLYDGDQVVSKPLEDVPGALTIIIKKREENGETRGSTA